MKWTWWNPLIKKEGHYKRRKLELGASAALSLNASVHQETDDSFDVDHQYCALEENISEVSLHTTTACKGVPDEMEVVASLKTPETASGKHQVMVPKGRSLIIYRTRQGHVTMELSAGFKVADRLVRRHLGDFFHVPDDQGIRQWIKKAFQRRTSNTKCAARILALFMPSSHGVEIPFVYNPSTFEPFV